MTVEKVPIHFSRTRSKLIASEDENLKPILRDLKESLTMFYLWKETKEFTNTTYLHFIEYYYHRSINSVELNQLILTPMVDLGYLTVKRVKYRYRYTITDSFLELAYKRKSEIVGRFPNVRVVYRNPHKQLVNLPPFIDDNNT